MEFRKITKYFLLRRNFVIEKWASHINIALSYSRALMFEANEIIIFEGIYTVWVTLHSL